MDWILGVDDCRAVYSTGGRFALDAEGETPDTQDALFTWDNWTASFSLREAAVGASRAPGLEFCGTRGSLTLSRSGFRLTGDPEIPPENQIPQFTGDHPVGGPRPLPGSGTPEPRTPPREDSSGSGDEQFVAHARNFLDCVRSRETPVSDLESGHRVAGLCHLANLSLRLGRLLRWDAGTETVRDDPEANGMLTRTYRAPWDRELAALG
ncbi:MAG: hypothetical protein FJX77_13250 [Armatimonadetes bacterium]|nr:hypothetical protein [Armatimonadota bacterium]